MKFTKGEQRVIKCTCFVPFNWPSIGPDSSFSERIMVQSPKEVVPILTILNFILTYDRLQTK